MDTESGDNTEVHPTALSYHFHINPLGVLVVRGEEHKEHFLPPSTAAGELITSIQRSIDSHEKKMTSSCCSLLYSPNFKCFTSLPFYGASLAQLKRLAKTIDGDPVKRDLVWEQLFVIVAHEPEGESQGWGKERNFQPLLSSFSSQARVNVGDIEILLLSFLLSLRAFPTLLADSPIDLPKGDDLKKVLLENASSFFQYLQIQLSSPKTPLPPDLRASKRDKQSLVFFDTMKKLATLQNWLPALEALNEEKKSLIWRTVASALPNQVKSKVSSYDGETSFTQVLQQWHRSPSPNIAAIVGLENAILMLHQHHILSDQAFTYQHGEAISDTIAQSFSPASTSIQPAKGGWRVRTPSPLPRALSPRVMVPPKILKISEGVSAKEGDIRKPRALKPGNTSAFSAVGSKRGIEVEKEEDRKKRKLESVR